jgi:hypothetical protein
MVFLQHILMKSSYFGFVFWWSLSYFSLFSERWRLHTWLRSLMKASLALYFDEGFIFSLKNEGFTTWLCILTKASLASFFDEGFVFSLKNEGFTLDFIFWWMFCFFFEKWRFHTRLRILTKVSLTSYFDEGFLLWLCILMMAYLFFHFFRENEGFTPDFIFWRRFLWLHILMKSSYFGFVFWWRLSYFLFFL